MGTCNFLRGLILLTSLLILNSVYDTSAAKLELVNHRSRRASNLYVSLYEHENYRGQVYKQPIAKECSNLPKEYDDWASSVILHDRCVTLCEHPNCEGKCTEIFPNEKGKNRLRDLGLNDQVSSVKYCYRFPVSKF